MAVSGKEQRGLGHQGKVKGTDRQMDGKTANRASIESKEGRMESGEKERYSTQRGPALFLYNGLCAHITFLIFLKMTALF